MLVPTATVSRPVSAQLHLLRHHIRLPVIASQHAIRFGVIDDLPRLRINRQPPSHPVADIRVVHQRDRRHSDLDLGAQILVVAAAEAAVGLALIIAMFRNRETLNVDRSNLLKW